LGCKRVRRITPDGVIHTVSDTLAYDVAVDQKGNLYVSQFPGKIVRISPDGKTTPFAGTGIPGNETGDGGPAVNALVGASSLAVDPAGNLYIADTGTKTIRVVDPSGTISEYADFSASRIATDAAGNLYAIGDAAGNPADIGINNHVYRIQLGSVSQIGGLANVVALAAGGANTLFIARQRSDENPLHADSQIRKFTLSYQISTSP
jgi:sugar lactone lactonase YvrE